MCSSNSGARPAGVGVRWEKCSGLPMWRSGPISGWSTVTIAPRAARCASARWSSPFWTVMAETPACCSRSVSSSAMRSRVHSATRASRASAAARRPSDAAQRRVVGPAGDRAEARPVVVAHDRNRDPAVFAGARIDAVGRGIRRAVARLLERPPGARGLEVDLADQVRGRFGLRHLDQLPFPGYGADARARPE